MNRRTASLMISLATAAFSGAILLAPAVAQAQSSAADTQAEKFRLTEEMKRLAQRNAWPGVEAKYEELLSLKVPLDFDTHRLAAQSAKYLGKTYEVYQRLERAFEVKADPDVKSEKEQIDSKYGRVKLVGNERWEVTLRRPSMPFAPDERKSVEYAIMVAKESGGFTGMLPVGHYIIGAEDAKNTREFDVKTGPDFQEIEITHDLVTSSEGLIVYHGPVAFAGYAFTATPAPTSAVLTADGSKMQAEPATKRGSGVAAEVGYELGFTRLFAVAVTFDYRDLFESQDQFHGYTGALYGLLRPGNLRIGVAGIYGRWGGQGSGVYTVFNNGQGPSYQRKDIIFDGQSWAGGAKLSVGYGLLDFDPLQGVVELGGSWQTDGSRNFFSGGIRVGIVPKVPRFHE